MKFLPYFFVCLFMIGCGGFGSYVIYTAGSFSGKVAKDYYDEAFEPKAVEPKEKEKKDD